MPSNGLAASRWAAAAAPAPAAPVACAGAGAGAGVVPSQSHPAPPQLQRQTSTGLAASRWAQPSQPPARVAEDQEGKEEQEQEITTSTTSTLNTELCNPIDSSNTTNTNTNTNTDTTFAMSLMLSLIFDLEGNLTRRHPTPPQSRSGGTITNLLRSDPILSQELTTYLEGFSPAARDIAFDQLVTYVGRVVEHSRGLGRRYDGWLGRECGSWMERLRVRDLRGEIF